MCDIPEHELSKDVKNEATAAINNLLPEKSRRTYEKEYANFQKWKKTKHVNHSSEKILLVYFSEKSAKSKPSCLWSHYSMLKSTLRINENVDISKYNKLILLLKKLSVGYKPKKSRILKSDDVMRFLKQAPDDTHLFVKVVVIMGLHGACRSDELYKLQFSNVDDRGSVIVVSVMDTKTRRNRTFCITNDNGGPNLVGFVRKYIALRPSNVPHNKFFICYRQKRCTVQAVGINTLYKIPRKVANFLKLPNPELYTGHCFRRSAVTMLGANLITVKHAGGWKSSTVAETYIEESLDKKIEVSEQILVAENVVKEEQNEEDVASSIAEPTRSDADTTIGSIGVYSRSKCTPNPQELSNSAPTQTPNPPLVKRMKCSTTDTIKKPSEIKGQEIFDNFGSLIASQLKSIPMEDALLLQMEISQIVNNRLLAICRNEATTNSLLSRPSASSASYSDCTYNYLSENLQDESELNQDMNELEKDYNIFVKQETL